MTRMLIDRAVVEQALGALRCVDLRSLVPDYGSGHYSVDRLDGPQVKSAITALEAALAEPVQEPAEHDNETRAEIAEQQVVQKPVQEPVAWRYKDARGNYLYCGYVYGFDKEHPQFKPVPLYTAPPQRKPLTSDKDRPGATYVEGYGYVDTKAVRAVERAHEIKEWA